MKLRRMKVRTLLLIVALIAVALGTARVHVASGVGVWIYWGPLTLGYVHDHGRYRMLLVAWQP